MSTFSRKLKTGILGTMDIYAIRKKNLVKLIGSQKKGSCAERWGMAPAHLSQILSDKTAKNLGDDVARRIEHVEGLPRGWFDSIPLDEATANAEANEPGLAESEGTVESAADLVRKMLAKHGKGLPEEARKRLLAAADVPNNVITADFSGLRTRPDEILIPQYDVRGAMGHGQVPADYNEAIRNLIVREDVLREKGVTYTSTSALAMITGWGQSMEGTINDKDPVIVDRGVTEFVGEGVYVVTWHGLLYIKRLQMKDEDHLWLISDNKNNKDQEARIDDVTIHAKVLLVWNARKL